MQTISWLQLSWQAKSSHLLFFKRALVALLLALVALIPACSRWKMGPGCTIHVVNDSGGTMRNIEVAYPGGSFGIASLSPGQVHLRWVQTRKDNGCHFTLKHEDASGKQYATKDFNFENSCPAEIFFTVNSHHEVTTALPARIVSEILPAARWQSASLRPAAALHDW